ncbi:MAG: hypothetical protein ACI8XU_000664 [Kiritimatiellia bacterium]|jgi:hypothetical protein
MLLLLELAAYNRAQPITQMIVCSEDSRSFTRIRQRRCVAVEKMYRPVDQARELGVLNSVRGIGTAE